MNYPDGLSESTPNTPWAERPKIALECPHCGGAFVDDELCKGDFCPRCDEPGLIEYHNDPWPDRTDE